jgi:hypothetical protein
MRGIPGSREPSQGASGLTSTGGGRMIEEQLAAASPEVRAPDCRDNGLDVDLIRDLTVWNGAPMQMRIGSIPTPRLVGPKPK